MASDKAEFIKELKKLLKKYKAEICAENVGGLTELCFYVGETDQQGIEVGNTTFTETSEVEL